MAVVEKLHMHSVLILDNFDSFTFNLSQLLGDLCGQCAPLVATNATSWEEVQRLIVAHAIDTIVISPGPGNPAANPADFGVCAAVLENCPHIPTLAVCLGHQGLAHLHGGKVVRAPQPMHGRLSEIVVLHDHSDEHERLFRGIASGFKAVRYHSLIVERHSLPPSLQPLAQTRDGLLMAFRVAGRPQWGVQYHPESICTEYGKNLLQNFLDSARAWERKNKATVEEGNNALLSAVATIPSTRHGPTAVTPLLPPQAGAIQLSLLVDSLSYPDPTVFPGDFSAAVYADMFSRAGVEHAASFWLDSATAASGKGDDRARFSFMGASGGPHSHQVEYDVASCTITLQTPDAAKRRVKLGVDSNHGFFFDWLESKLASMKIAAVERLDDQSHEHISCLPFDFHGGYVGYIGYELRHECGHAASERRDANGAPEWGDCAAALPTAALLFADRFLVFDMVYRRVYVLSLAQSINREVALSWISRTKSSLQALASRDAGSGVAQRPRESCAGGSWLSATLARGKTQYMADIRSSLAAIAAGETYEVCLTVGVSVDAQPPAVLPLYTELRRSNPAPYGALLRFGGAEPGEGKRGYALLSSSPERFLRIGQTGTIESKPIKGTAGRGATVEEDDALSRELRSSEKERAENLMIVDLTRHDLGQVCKIGSVHVPPGKLFAVESFATVHQLVSTVRGQLPLTADGKVAAPVGAVASCFPPGSMTGAPKYRTMQILGQLEQSVPRGAYSGALGFFSLSGAVDLSVVIRTLELGDHGVRIGAGGAIVHQSSPESEFAEVLLKLRAPLSALARTLGRGGIEFGPDCDGEKFRLLVSSAAGDPTCSAFTTIPWDYERDGDGGDDGPKRRAVKQFWARPQLIWLWNVDMYLRRLEEHCERLQIALPTIGLRAELTHALRSWTPPTLPSIPAARGQGLLRVEWTRSGKMHLAARVLQRSADETRGHLAAVSLPAPWWGQNKITGTKHGAWSPYIEAMHCAWAQGGHCALLVDPDGTVIDGDRLSPILVERVESTGCEFRLRYPPRRVGAVDSVTIRALTEAFERTRPTLGGRGKAALHLEEAAFALQDVFQAEAVLVVGSGIGVGNITLVNGRPIGCTRPSATGATIADDIFGIVAGCLSLAREHGWDAFTGADRTTA